MAKLTASTARAYEAKQRMAKKAARQKIEARLDELYSQVVDHESVKVLHLPGWREAEVLLESGLAGMVQISKQTEDIEMAYKASGFLIEFAKREMERAGNPQVGSELMASLENLYRRALPEREGLVVEVTEEDERAKTR